MNQHYTNLSQVPSDALKTIQAGRLKGMSDIKPQWRIEAITKEFGLCGIGWRYVITKQWTEQAADGAIFAFTNIDLFIKIDSQWSEAIPGTGGSMLIEKEKAGLHNNDECFKMSLTDALSVAMKAIGVGASIYRGKSDSKYVKNDTPQSDIPVEDNRPWITEAQLNAVIKRVNDGERDAIDNALKAFRMRNDYKQKLINLK